MGDNISQPMYQLKGNKKGITRYSIVGEGKVVHFSHLFYKLGWGDKLFNTNLTSCHGELTLHESFILRRGHLEP